MKKLIALILCAALCLAFAACGADTTPSADSHAVTDLIGREVQVPNDIQRLAAIAGPTYEMTMMLGGADKVTLVKSGHTKNYPVALMIDDRLAAHDGLAANPSSTVNIEDYLSKDIDLVLYYDNETELKKFDSVGMAAVVVSKNTGLLDTLEEARSQTIDQYIENMTEPVAILAETLGTEEAKAEYQQWHDYCAEKLRMVYERTKDLSPEDMPTVYWGNTWGEEMRMTYTMKNRWYEVHLAGGDLLAPTENSNFPEVTQEQLSDWDPDILIVDNHGGSPELVIEDLKTGINRELTAVKNGDIYRIPAGVFFLDKGTTVTLLVMWMAQNFHPELFSDINMVDELKYYYHEFYEFDLTDDQAQMILDGWVEN